MNSRATGRRTHGFYKGFGREERIRGYLVVTSTKKRRSRYVRRLLATNTAPASREAAGLVRARIWNASLPSCIRIGIYNGEQ